MNDKFDYAIVGFLLACFFTVIVWLSYDKGYSSAIKLCSAHSTECSILFQQGAK